MPVVLLLIKAKAAIEGTECISMCSHFVTFQSKYKDYSRDPQRTPMQWNGGPAAGFTSGDPWLPLAEDAYQRNVEVITNICSTSSRLLEALF